MQDSHALKKLGLLYHPSSVMDRSALPCRVQHSQPCWLQLSLPRSCTRTVHYVHAGPHVCLVLKISDSCEVFHDHCIARFTASAATTEDHDKIFTISQFSQLSTAILAFCGFVVSVRSAVTGLILHGFSLLLGPEIISVFEGIVLGRFWINWSPQNIRFWEFLGAIWAVIRAKSPVAPVYFRRWWGLHCTCTMQPCGRDHVCTRTHRVLLSSTRRVVWFRLQLFFSARAQRVVWFRLQQFCTAVSVPLWFFTWRRKQYMAHR